MLELWDTLFFQLPNHTPDTPSLEVCAIYQFSRFAPIHKQLLTLAESWPETVKLKFLAALAWSCGPLFSSPVIRGIPAILPLAVLCKYPAS